MAEYTPNYNLEKQQGNEFVNIEGINDNFDILDTEIKNAQDKADQAFRSASNGKEAIKTAITGIDPEVTIPTNATFAQLANAISQIQTGVDTEDATATAEQILAGMTAYVKGVKVTGTMIKHANDEYGNGFYSSPDICIVPAKGYWDGRYAVMKNEPNIKSENIKAGVNILGVPGKSSVVDTADATGGASAMLADYSGYQNGTKYTGTIGIVNPDYSDQIPAVNTSVGPYSGDGLNYAYLNGNFNGKYINGANWIRSYQPDLVASNIISGKTIFGIAGAAIGKRIVNSSSNSAAGNMKFVTGAGVNSSYNAYELIGSGLSFVPSLIIAVGIGVNAGIVIYAPNLINIIGYTAVDIIVFNTYSYNQASSAQSSGSLAANAPYFYVNSSGFCLPVSAPNYGYTWIAVE